MQAQMRPFVIQQFEDKWKVRFRAKTGGFYLYGTQGCIADWGGIRLYLAVSWLEPKYIFQLKALGFTQMMENRLRDWWLPPNPDAQAVSIAFEVIGKQPSQKTRKELLKSLRSAPLARTKTVSL